MMTDHSTNEMPTLEKVVTSTSAQESDTTTTPDIYARAAGDYCEAIQEGHEWSEGSGHPILKCTETSIGVFKWVDTGRVRS